MAFEHGREGSEEVLQSRMLERWFCRVGAIVLKVSEQHSLRHSMTAYLKVLRWGYPGDLTYFQHEIWLVSRRFLLLGNMWSWLGFERSRHLSAFRSEKFKL